MQRRLDAGLEVAKERLRDVQKNAHAMNVGDLIEGPPRRTAGVEEIADIDVACRDDAVEWRLDLLETGKLLEPVDLGLLGRHIGFGDRQRRVPRGRVQAIGVALFQGRPPLGDEPDGPRVSRLAEIGVGLRLFDGGMQLDELRLRLFKLLVEIRRRNRDKHVALLHMRADIAMPGSHVAAGAGEQRVDIEGADVSRQKQRLFRRSRSSLNETQGRNRLLFGPGFYLLLAFGAIEDAERSQSDRANRNEAQQKQDPAWPGGAAGGRFGRTETPSLGGG